MRYLTAFVITLCMIMPLSSCLKSSSTVKDDLISQNDKKVYIDENSVEEATQLIEQSEESSLCENIVNINGRSFSVEEINEGIKDTFNCQLYYEGHDSSSNYITSNTDVILHKNIEYDLYFDPYYNHGENPYVFPKKVYIVITNMLHPLSTEKDFLLYSFGVDITDLGVRSDFCYEGHEPQNEPFIVYGKAPIHLGRYSMRIDEIVKPQFETMDTTWIENTKSEIRMYMDKNDFHQGAPDENLAPGNYNVYVQKFFKSDGDSLIIFEHEDGSVYRGFYYFVHYNSGKRPADLNHVELVDNPDTKPFKMYLDTVRSDPALSFEYFVK